VLVWINGPFGVGKTSVAAALRGRTSGARLFDPERLGYVLQRLPLVGRARGDFQDLAAWRRWTRRTAWLLERARRGSVIVPMTLVDERYFEEIVGGLRGAGVDVRHFTLTASAGAIRKRLRGRDGEGSWAEHQLDRCLTALRHPRFAHFVSTEGRTVDDIAGELSNLLQTSV
jgi:AAA domain